MKKLSKWLPVFNTFLIMGVVTTGLFAQSNEVFLNVSKDNTLYQSSNGSLSNGAGAYMFAGKTNGGFNRRCLIAFDLSAIPKDSKVESVTLTLNMSKTGSSSEVIALHRVLAAWGEGSSNASLNEGAGTNAQTGDATWLHRFWGTNETWETPGGDFSSTTSSSQTIGNEGSYTWESTEQLVTDVQSWVDNPDINFGWTLIGNESKNRTAKRFDSKENPQEENRPILKVAFLTATKVEENNGIISGKFELAQNSPNPFNPATIIKYTIPAGNSEQFTLKVYDLRGALVKTLADNISSPGVYSVVWDGTDIKSNKVASGVYIYQLKAGVFIKSNKMIFMK